MGLMAETNILQQAKKGQGETNQRLDALIAEQQVTNDLLRQLIAAIEAIGGLPRYRPAGQPRQ